MVCRKMKWESGKKLTFIGMASRLLLMVVVTVLQVGMLVSPVAGEAADNVIVGKVVKVLDGDSCKVRQGGRIYEVRLWGIDAPEYGQPYGAEARRLAKTLLDNARVQVTVKSRDSYGRTVGAIKVGRMDVNEELVRQGAAWVYRRYCQEEICGDWRELEEFAKARRLGLWRDRKPVPPWRWRQRH